MKMSNEYDFASTRKARNSSFSDGWSLSSSVPSSNYISNADSVNNSSSHDSNQIRYSFQKRPFVIGVAGGAASGKSTVCSKIIERLGPIYPKSIYLSHEKPVVRISQDSFYRKLPKEDKELVKDGMFNFDHPSAFDVELMVKTLKDICDGKVVRVPIYNYADNEISDEEEIIYPADVVLFDGLLLFYFPELRRMFHMKIFVDTDPDTRLSRRVMCDVKERKRELDTVLAQYLNFVKPSFEEFCLPTKKYADIVVPRGPDNEVAVNLIVTQIRSVFDPSLRHQSIKLIENYLKRNNNEHDNQNDYCRIGLINNFNNDEKQKILNGCHNNDRDEELIDDDEDSGMLSSTTVVSAEPSDDIVANFVAKMYIDNGNNENGHIQDDVEDENDNDVDDDLIDPLDDLYTPPSTYPHKHHHFDNDNISSKKNKNDSSTTATNGDATVNGNTSNATNTIFLLASR